MAARARTTRLAMAMAFGHSSETAADFTPLEFSQRYVGTFADDGTAIEGGWDLCHDGSRWRTDFQLSYHRRA